MPNYHRLHRRGGVFFFTVALRDRSERLLTENIDSLRSAFRETNAFYPFRIDAIVVLPEHLHCIWTLPAADAEFALRWRLLKGRFSKSICGGETLSLSRASRRERGIWQRRYWEHAIRDETDYRAHLDYIHWNPVKHGHTTTVAEWPHSSFHRFVRRGAYPADWGGTEMREGLFGE